MYKLTNIVQKHRRLVMHPNRIDGPLHKGTAACKTNPKNIAKARRLSM